MCSPQAAYGATGSAQAILSYFQRDAAYTGQRRAFNATAALAEAAADLELRGIRTRQLQEREAAALTIQSIAIETKKRRGTARVAALEAGVGGETSALIDNDFTQQGLNLSTGVERNLSFVEAQLEAEAIAARQRQYSRVLSAAPLNGRPSILEPFLGTGLSIAEATTLQPQGG